MPAKIKGKCKQEGHDGPVSLHWLIFKIPSYQTLQYLGIGLKNKTSNKRAMMALNRSPESFSPTNAFYIFVPLVPTCDPRGRASFYQ